MPGAAPISRVLVVDDEHLVADTLVLILKGKGFDARAAYSGEEAAEISLTWAPDAVITDVVMGPMDGASLAIYLSQALPNCKVLLMSGNPATIDLLSSAKSQGHDFPIVAKPSPPDDILEFLGPSAGIAEA
jgi:CheY-like chemotaxis protein